MKTKDEVLNCFKLYVRDVVEANNWKIKRFQTDGDKIYSSAVFRAYLALLHVPEPQISAPYMHESNGVAERYWLTLQDLALSYIIAADLDPVFWTLAFQHACWIKNRLPHSGINFDIPYFRLTGKLPKLSNVRIFGCKAYAYIDSSLRKKMESKAREGLYMGHHPASNSYILWDSIKREIFHSGMVRFCEDISVQGNLISTPTDLSKFSPFGPVEADPNFEPEEIQNLKSKVSGVLDIGTYFQSDAGITHAIVQVTCVGDENPHWILLYDLLTSPDKHYQSFSNFIKKRDLGDLPPLFLKVQVKEVISGRTRFKPAFIVSTDYEDENGMFFQVVFADGLTQDVKPEDFSSPLPVKATSMSVEVVTPNSFRESQSLPEAAKWAEATESELNSMLKNGVFKVVKWPKHHNVLKSRLVYKIKRDGRFKARFVAKGFSQIEGVDFFETFSPVTQLTTFRLFLQSSLDLGLSTFHLDVETAFLNAELKETIYVQIPEGMSDVDEDGNKVCWRLLKALYGLKQAGREWYLLISTWLTDYGFQQSIVDPCLFIYKKAGVICIVDLYVDDVLGSCNSEAFRQTFIKDLRKRFAINDLGRITDALGMHLSYGVDSITISQEKYIDEVLVRHSMDECNPSSLPLDPGFQIHNFDSPKTEEEKAKLAKYPYAKLIGELLWICRCCRPDLAFAVGVFSRYTSCFSLRHFKALKNVLRYLKGTKSLGITLRKSNLPLDNVLSCYSDSDFAGDRSDRLSCSGNIVFWGSSPISWSSKKQTTVALSTTEAEANAVLEASKEVVFERHILASMYLLQKNPTVVHVDNTGAFHILRNPVLNSRSKYFDVKLFKLREWVSDGIISPRRVSTKENVSDIFTKALTKPLFEKFLPRVLNLT